MFENIIFYIYSHFSLALWNQSGCHLGSSIFLYVIRLNQNGISIGLIIKLPGIFKHTKLGKTLHLPDFSHFTLVFAQLYPCLSSQWNMCLVACLFLKNRAMLQQNRSSRTCFMAVFVKKGRFLLIFHSKFRAVCIKR